ncbi:MAG: hypothetical protein FWC39_09530 [Bacteroidetes bacterium]|nr:hypothetical protein [Bacteroidota bacterium]
MKKTLLTMLVFLTATIAFSQNNYQDVVYLKNGSIIRGIIIEQIPNESLRIETADRSVFVFNMNEVEKMTKEQIVPYEEALNYDYVGGRQWFINLGFGSNAMNDGNFAGAKFVLGHYINPASLLSFEFSGGSFRSEEIGTFSWYQRFPNGEEIIHHNGKIYFDYTASSTFVSWSYIKDLSDKLQWRIGPSLGILSISRMFIFSPSGLPGEPNIQFSSQSALAFGANTGIMWNFSKNKRWFFDLGYKLYGNTGIRFAEETVLLGSDNLNTGKKDFSNVSNELMFSLGWRFGKAY